MTRTFTATEAERESVPLLVGLMGPSGSGKTFSALRMAKGIQEVVGGDVYGIDTEAKRMLHYADMFKFKHVPFTAPFGSVDYLEAIQYCVSKGAKTIIIDSMSHEHEGAGGMLDLHGQIVQRMSGGDSAKAERVKMLAWAEPKAKRRKLINGILQLDVNLISCFRAKETSKPGKNPQTGKNEVVSLGFMPIAGDEFVFEQTVNCLLLPAAKGVPSWQSHNVGERQMMKLPEQFRHIFKDNRPLDESIGRELALWARGGSAKQAETATVAPSPELVSNSKSAAMNGSDSYRQFFGDLTKEERHLLAQSGIHDQNKRAAELADQPHTH